MPIVKAPKARSDQIVSLNHLISLGEVKEEKDKQDSLAEGEREEEEEEDNNPEPPIDESDLWMLKYDKLAQKTKNIPLSHLGCCKEGGELFNDLCMWVDINQKYVELGLFPQWYDIARELHIDEMKTEWVKVCVRPEQSFTRAILEIYMNDGGSLGDVIHALRKQKQYRIIQEISEKAEEFMDVYTVYHKNNFNPATAPADESHVYSIMRTLFDTFNKFGYEDPLGKYQDYSQGFKQYLQNLSDPSSVQHNLLLNAVNLQTDSAIDSQDSGYTSPHSYSGYLPSMPEYGAHQAKSLSALRLKDKSKKDEEDPQPGMTTLVVDTHQQDTPDLTIRILLVFADDGVMEAEAIISNLEDFVFEDNPAIKVDMFRLNEIDMWNAMLLNPEACIVKWLDEMDFVMPILSPSFLRDLHEAGNTAGPPAPTSPLINKYIYSLLRSNYVSSGCKNHKVRPLLPQEFEPIIGRSKPLVAEPLFKMWNYTDRDSLKKRLTAMIKIWVKNRGH